MLHNLCCDPACAMSLYKSIQGKYFVCSSREEFGDDKYAWAGTSIYGRRCPAQATIVAEEDRKFICPPGGNFSINCIPPEKSNEKISGACSIWFVGRTLLIDYNA